MISLSLSGNFSKRSRVTESKRLSNFSCLPSLSDVRLTSLIFSSPKAVTASISSGFLGGGSTSGLGLPTFARSSSCNPTISLIFSCPNSRAERRSPSEISRHSPSTILTESLVPATTRFMSLSSSSEKVGLATNSPPNLPTLTAPTG